MDITNQHLPIEIYSPNQQYQPSHYKKKVDQKPHEGCCRRNDSPTTRFVDQSPAGRLHKKCYERIQHKTQPPTTESPQWSRNNIALTMEYFEPISTASTPKRYSSPDYSYAYYETGAAMRHSNIPKMQTTDRLCETSSTRSSPKSIRSLLSTPKNDKTKPNNRHTYTTRYGTQENIYEDISSIGAHSGVESSSQSINSQGRSKIEFQDILHNHYRVLEELNLSVEELLLSTTKKTNVPSSSKIVKRSSKSRTIKARNSDKINSTNIFPSSVKESPVGEDSGFSGSSSGASYIGTLRNYKTALTRSHRNATNVNTLNNVTDCGAMQDANNVGITNDNRKVSLKMINQLESKQCAGSSKGLKFPFWNKKR